MNTQSFDQLVDDALQAHFAGWDFSYLNGRSEAEELPWDYGAVVREAMNGIGSMLDIGTVEGYRGRLLAMHEHILDTGGLTVEGHRLFVQAQKA